MDDKSSLLFGQPIFPDAYLASPVARDSGTATIAEADPESSHTVMVKVNGV